ncbi:hypothetical protein [Streptomyces griseus]|uniref:hypothetical protein n=1 Tax=Streptomyces griseus TaxID=1911 RepID=UPI0018FEC504|nr:hypothetical protein [Streptomyces griseus]
MRSVAKYDMPVLLVAICKDRPTATWAAGPFECTVGPWTTQVTRPFVLGPTTVPEITDTSMVTRNPAAAALSAIVHSENRRAPAILEMAARGFLAFDPPTTKRWVEVVEVGLENTSIRKVWKALLKSLVTHYPGHRTMFEETYLEGKAEGKALGEAKGVLRVLEVRGLAISDDVRESIITCTDLDRIDDWLVRAGTVSRAEDLLTEAPEGD